MKCGNKKDLGEHTHDTVAQVRACYAESGDNRARYTHQGDSAWESADGNPEGYGDPVPARIPSITDWAKFKEIPAAYYATPSLTGNNDLDFWKVEKPETGKWDGYVFVKRVIGGHDDANIPRGSKKKVKSQRIERVTQMAALQAIFDYGPDKAHELFGTELKYCRVCGIHLTDELSRELGIGPVCRAA